MHDCCKVVSVTSLPDNLLSPDVKDFLNPKFDHKSISSINPFLRVQVHRVKFKTAQLTLQQ
jgi:hypothetical protein